MPVYSHSKLSTFETCPLQYRFRYVDRIRTDFESIEAFMGKKVHETLEGIYADPARARAAGVEGAVGSFRRLWDRDLTAAVQVIRPDMKVEDYRTIGERCVRTFWEENEPFVIEPEKIIGLEMKVEIALDKERRYLMLGYVDRAQRAEPGVIEIHDYKTSASLPREGSLRFDRQLPLYEMGLRQRFPETREVRLVWHFLAHAKTIVETRTREQLDRIRRACIALIQTVEKTWEFPSKKGPLCAWCSYQGICPEWKDRKPVAMPAFPAGRLEEEGALLEAGSAAAVSPHAAPAADLTHEPVPRMSLEAPGPRPTEHVDPGPLTSWSTTGSRATEHPEPRSVEEGEPAGPGTDPPRGSQPASPPQAPKPRARPARDTGQLPLF